MRIFFVLLLALPSIGYCQHVWKECFDEKGNIVDESVSDYCVIGKKVWEIRGPRKTGDTVSFYIDTVKAVFTKERKLKFLKLYNEEGEQHGNYVEYYNTGKLKERGTYSGGKKSGLVSYYYPDGKLHYTLEFLEGADRQSPQYLITAYRDSVGKMLVKERNGFCNCYLNEEAGLNFKGNVVDGRRDSVWVGTRNDTLNIIEQYERGKFVSGIRYENGIETKYDELEIYPEFPGGYEPMYRFVARNLRYPVGARNRGAQGVVYIQFVVAKDGTLENLKRIGKEVHQELEVEALRVVSLMPKWTPGYQRGKAVAVSFVLPIKFKLS